MYIHPKMISVTSSAIPHLLLHEADRRGDERKREKSEDVEEKERKNLALPEVQNEETLQQLGFALLENLFLRVDIPGTNTQTQTGTQVASLVPPIERLYTHPSRLPLKQDRACTEESKT